MSVQFALAAPLKKEGGFVYRPGKYFEIGKTFVDRAGIEFEITPTEAEAAVASFERQSMGVIHEPTPLDGLFGHIEKLWIDGSDIMAEFAVPEWLHDGKEGAALKISSEWDIATKKPGGASYVFEPAVKDAVIQAAFSANPEAEATRQADAIKALFDKHITPTGQMSLQDIHDAAARAGAICDKGNIAKMAARHEMTAIQGIHDLTTGHGAKCASGDYPYRSMSMFSEKPPARPVQPTQGNPLMSLKDKLNRAIAAFNATAASTEKLDPLTDDDMKPATAQFSESQLTEMANQRAEFASFRAATLKTAAETFVDDLQTKGQILTYEKPLILAQFAQTIADDVVAGGTVKFAALDDDMKPVEKTGTRFDALKATLSARTPTGLTSELVGTGRVTEDDIKVLFSRETTKETEEDKQKRIDKEVDADRARAKLPNK